MNNDPRRILKMYKPLEKWWLSSALHTSCMADTIPLWFHFRVFHNEYLYNKQPVTRFTFMGPCIVNVFKHSQQDATLHNGIYYYKRSTCFRRFLRPSSWAQNRIHSIGYLSSFFLILTAIVSWNSLTIAVWIIKSSTNTRCCVYSFELQMMGGGTAFSASYRYREWVGTQLTIAVRSRKVSTNTRCCVYSFELLMMGGGIAFSASCRYREWVGTHDGGKKQKKLDKYPMLCIQFWAPDDGRRNRFFCFLPLSWVSWNSLTIAVRSGKSSTNTRCCVYSFELLMMGGGTAWNV